MIGRRIGRFRIVSRLGQGGMATVWKARDELLGREVALKILDEQLAGSEKVRRRFVHEAQTGAMLDHPGAVAVFDSGEADDAVYIAMQLVEGETLSDAVGHRLLPIAEAIRIVSAVAEVLAHAHERGIVHRDVTGRNVMIGRDGRVFVLDFGLALATWESRVTSSGTSVGTAQYMAPEMIRGEEADARTDLYGLGVVFYEALTGTFPHRGEPAIAVTFAALHGEPASPRQLRPEVPEAVERIVLKMMARERGARYSGVAELLQDLRDREGLREIAPVEVSEPPAARRLDSALGSDARPRPLYLSVLPFRAGGAEQDPALGSVAERLTEIVGCALAKSSSVRIVRAPPASEIPAEGELGRFAERIGANALMQGRLERAGSVLRVSYVVLDPRRGSHLAGDVIDGSALQPFDLEDQLVASVTRALGLAPGAAAAPSSKPADPAASERLAQALGYLRRYDNEASVDGAIQLLERLIASEGENALYDAALARAFLRKKEHTQQRVWENRAAAACARAIGLDPSRPEVRTAHGLVLNAAGRHAEALVEFRMALEEQPASVEASLGSALARLGAGDPKGAMEDCDRAVGAHPRDWRCHSVKGWIHFISGENEAALEPWRTVIELTPDNARGHLNLGNALYRLDRLDEAVAMYRRSLAINPFYRTYTTLGTALYHQGRDEDSLAAFRKATELTASDAIVWGNLGNACHCIPGHETEAAFALDRAIGLMREQLDLNPAQADGWARMSGWLVNRGRREEAERAIHRALELAPRDPYCMTRAGHVYFQLGQREACIHWLREAVRAGYGTGELEKSREFAPLRNDPEFARLIGAHGRNDGKDSEPHREGGRS